MPLDPIVSLAVAIAEAPGTSACLLGSGVSVDAGVPTGWAIYRDGLRRLHRLETGAHGSLSDDGLDDWLGSTGRDSLDYSSLLDLIAPDPAIRRELLAGYFDGIDPGPTHQQLAALALAGAVRVFVTTNFDRLLERALLSLGIEPVVVSDDATLAAAPRREHSPVFVVKAHGDYLQETIRNTPTELAALEPGLTGELETIANNYGLVILGWSGSDPALVTVLRNRRSRYGVWWLSLTAPMAEPGRSVAEAIGARVIVRPGAEAFLSDLSGRLAAYRVDSSGLDPGSVHDELLALVRRGDDIGLDEALRREKSAFELAIESVTADHLNDGLDAATVDDAWQRLRSAADRRLASLIPLALYRADLLATELDAHARWATSRQPQGGGLTWQQAWRMPFWIIGFSLGALMVRLERYGGARAILATTWRDHYGHTWGFIGHPGETANALGTVFSPPPPPGQPAWPFPAWTLLIHELSAKRWLADRYPDWLRRENEPQASLTSFALLFTIAERLRDGSDVVAWWTLNPEMAKNYALQLHGDAHLRQEAAAAVGLTLDQFDEQASDLLASAVAVAPFAFPGVGQIANALRTGSPF